MLHRHLRDINILATLWYYSEIIFYYYKLGALQINIEYFYLWSMFWCFHKYLLCLLKDDFQLVEMYFWRKTSFVGLKMKVKVIEATTSLNLFGGIPIMLSGLIFHLLGTVWQNAQKGCYSDMVSVITNLKFI